MKIISIIVFTGLLAGCGTSPYIQFVQTGHRYLAREVFGETYEFTVQEIAQDGDCFKVRPPNKILGD